MNRISLFMLVFVLLALPGRSFGEAEDRAALGRVLATIPPNGPLWKHGTLFMRLKSKRAGMAPVVFPHWSHRTKYTCRVCHVELEFGMHMGDTGITRDQYLAGKYCGACHDGKTAFSVRAGAESQCGRCHMKQTEELEKRFESLAASLPSSDFGNGIDWGEALRSGKISPRNTIQASPLSMHLPEKLRGALKLGTTSPRSDVTFSHEEHFAELDCSNCHPDIFNIKKKGTQKFAMSANIYGNFCGACHMRVAFPMNDCRRCHPQISANPSR